MEIFLLVALACSSIAGYKERISLYNMDAVDFMDTIENTACSRIFFYIDPPYYKKGHSLYHNFYDARDHTTVCHHIEKLCHPWILTYDNVPDIRKIYSGYRQFEYTLSYSAQEKRMGTEILIPSKGLRLPREFRQSPSPHPQKHHIA